MMMMMTGRVLLVCALCVLWCGAGGSGRAETSPEAPGGVSQGGNSPDGTNNTTNGAGRGVNSGATAK
ncbi:putative Mucin-associated surface protein (MASP) [Trypanosoma cruzi]|nr:putative Mucin-associated surface protein (MASP) [Trypanosoma cruzi]